MPGLCLDCTACLVGIAPLQCNGKQPNWGQTIAAATFCRSDPGCRGDAVSHPTMKRKLFAGVCFAAAIALVAGLYSSLGTQAAPETSFLLLDGSRKTTSDFRGKVALVNFWATSCTTCVAEMPNLVRTYEKYKAHGYETLAVAMSYDPPNYVVKFAETRKLPFLVAIDQGGTAAKAWDDVKLTPTTFLVNRNGEIVKRYVGAPNFDELHALIEVLLVEN